MWSITFWTLEDKILGLFEIFLWQRFAAVAWGWSFHSTIRRTSQTAWRWWVCTLLHSWRFAGAVDWAKGSFWWLEIITWVLFDVKWLCYVRLRILVSNAIVNISVILVIFLIITFAVLRTSSVETAVSVVDINDWLGLVGPCRCWTEPLV